MNKGCPGSKEKQTHSDRGREAGDAGEGSELGPMTASPDVTVAFPEFSMIPIMNPEKGGKFEFQFR